MRVRCLRTSRPTAGLDTGTEMKVMRARAHTADHSGTVLYCAVLVSHKSDRASERVGLHQYIAFKGAKSTQGYCSGENINLYSVARSPKADHHQGGIPRRRSCDGWIVISSSSSGVGAEPGACAGTLCVCKTCQAEKHRPSITYLHIVTKHPVLWDCIVLNR